MLMTCLFVFVYLVYVMLDVIVRGACGISGRARTPNPDSLAGLKLTTNKLPTVFLDVKKAEDRQGL